MTTDNPWKNGKKNGKTNGEPIWLQLLRNPWVEFPPDVENMLIRAKIVYEEFPRQQEIAARLKSNPSLDWLVDERRRTFASLALQYAMLRDDERDEFIDGLRDWWKEFRANEDRAEATLAAHRRREMAS
jgi:hypothetical protein